MIIVLVMYNISLNFQASNMVPDMFVVPPTSVIKAQTTKFAPCQGEISTGFNGKKTMAEALGTGG